MAALNIVNVATINGKMATNTPSTTSRTSFLDCAAATGHTYKIDSLIAANVTATAATATVELYDGTNYRYVAYQISVPGNSSLIIVDKSTGLYLVDSATAASGGSPSAIHVTSGTASAITYSVTYEDLS